MAAQGHAVVSLPLLDLRPEPRHASELRSQLLMGETVRLLGRPRSGWVRVRNDADGYAGWVRQWGLVPATRERAARWRRLATGRIGAAMAQVLALPPGGRSRPARDAATVSPVFFGNRLIAAPGRGPWVRVELPDGRRGLLPRSALAVATPAIAARVGSLLGTPYLWGGRSPAGYDCSAFVQQVLLEQGVSLPRDAKDQCRSARRLADPGQARLGDLAFFRRPGEQASHVGLCLGGGFYAHCRGRVHVASMDTDNPLCDKDLLPQFMGWYRPRG